MNRYLVGFLLFCVVLLGASGLVAWWAGPTLLSLALDVRARDEPYFLVHLAAPAPEQTERYVAAYREPMMVLVAEDGGRLYRSGRVQGLVEGTLESAWTEAAFVEFARAADFIKLITSSSFRAASRANPAARLVLGTPQRLDSQSEASALLLCLFRLEAPAGQGAASVRGRFVRLEQHGGRIIWETPIEVLEGDGDAWNSLIAIEFVAPEAAQNWLRDPVSATERAMARREMQNLMMLLLATERPSPGEVGAD